jgi:tRNA nucleotidyltransferase (CCA-adding enzyme)
MMQTFDFLAPEITQSDIAAFAADKVNLKSERANQYREQVRNLREHLDRYISEHPDMGLAKMILSGSLAKSTALRTINDIDVGLYVKGDSAPHELGKLLEWLVERLRTTYHQIPRDKIYVDGPCVVVSFSGTELNVEITPILYEGDPKWRGYLFDRFTGAKVLTSIPLHIDFVRKRKAAQPDHFVQAIRLLKWWARESEKDTPGFSLRSFLVELITAKLADDGYKFADYHAGLLHFFLYVQRTGLKERIAFTDNYQASDLPTRSTGTVEIFDPVNPENNVAAGMTEITRRKFVELAESALDALSYARTCQTKGDALECWREVMGATFNA